MRGISQWFVSSFMGLWDVALVPNYWTAEEVFKSTSLLCAKIGSNRASVLSNGLFTRRQSAILSMQWSSKLVQSNISLLENPLATDVIKTYLFLKSKVSLPFQPLFHILSQIYLVFTLAHFFLDTYFNICVSSSFSQVASSIQVKLCEIIVDILPIYFKLRYQLLLTLNFLQYYWFSFQLVPVVLSSTVLLHKLVTRFNFLPFFHWITAQMLRGTWISLISNR